MTTSSVTWTQEMVEVAGTRINLVKGGSGDPLLVLHDEMGHPGWLRWHEALAQNHTLYIPWHPGFGESEPLDWVMNLHDLAVWYLGALDDLGLEGVDVMGFSLGGWLAAEMAVMNPQQFQRLALVGAAGVRPPRAKSSTSSRWWPRSSSPAASSTPTPSPSSRPSAPTNPPRSRPSTGKPPWKAPAA